MNVIILAGGRGTRLEEETRGVIPKPMLEVGGLPLLEHIIRLYAAQGHQSFIVAAGFLSDVIRKYTQHRNFGKSADGCRVAVVETGLDTGTGGRILRLKSFFEDGPVMVTYGDGLTDLNLHALQDFHLRQVKAHGVSATLTAVRPPNRFGYMDILDGLAVNFAEKPTDTGSWVNGGFYIFEPSVLDLVPGDACVLEQDVLPALASEGRLAAFKHNGWWQCVDHPRELRMLNDMWAAGSPPWTRWHREAKHENG